MQVGLHRGAGQNPRLEMKSPSHHEYPLCTLGSFSTTELLIFEWFE
jgi:hypothetical protein